MYELSVNREFSAAHAITISGDREPVHGHNWSVAVTVSGESLDSDRLLCDFHLLEAQLDSILSPFENRHLNEVQPFDTLNPTAEAIAEHIARAMQPALPRSVSLKSVAVTEAPGCVARFFLRS